jgi:quinol-cytochrome oxidoreductase complex cytochrome b subunit
MSFWGAKVITNLFSALPFVGEPLVTWLWGGYSVDNPTLMRFFSLHYLLPFVLTGLVFLHLWALHIPGNGNPAGIEVKSGQDTVSFHPYYTMKDGFALVVFMLVYAAFLFYAPNYLGHAINYEEANPLLTPEHIVPEWYYLPFYAILRGIPHKLGGVIALFGSLLVLFFLPWLDSSRVRSGTFRPLFKPFFWIFVAVCVGLGYLGAKPAEGGYVIAARILTIWYFLHFFVILPLLSRFERPRPQPASITEAVLARGSEKLAPSPAE